MLQYTNRFAAVSDEKGTEVMISFMQSSPVFNVEDPPEMTGKLDTIKVAELAMTFDAAKALEDLLHELLSQTEERQNCESESVSE